MPMLRLQIMKKLPHNKTTPELISIVLAFHTFVHITNKNQLLDHVSSQHDKKELKGFFTIRMHVGNKYHNLETITNYPGNKHICQKLVNHAIDVNIKKLLLSIVKKHKY